MSDGWRVDNVVLPDGEVMPHGEHVLARFDLRLRDVILRGCCLLHRPNKGWTVWGPAPGVKLRTKLRREIKTYLRRTYRLVGD